MANIEPKDKDLGKTLYEADWRQGALFYAPTAELAWNTRVEDSELAPLVITHTRVAEMADSELFIVATQDCDIVAETDKEPFVEALLCTVEHDRGRLAMLARNSARWFVVDVDKALVANAMDRVLFSKSALMRLSPIAWTGTMDAFRRYVDWLARRFDRPAIPTPLVKSFQKPVIDVLEKLSKQQPRVLEAFNRAVPVVRIKLPTRTTPPLDVYVVMLARDESLTAAELDAIEIVMKAVREKVDPGKVQVAAKPWIVTAEGISLADYNRTRPLPLDYFSYEGNEPTGAEPPMRT